MSTDEMTADEQHMQKRSYTDEAFKHIAAGILDGFPRIDCHDCEHCSEDYGGSIRCERYEVSTNVFHQRICLSDADEWMRRYNDALDAYLDGFEQLSVMGDGGR